MRLQICFFSFLLVGCAPSDVFKKNEIRNDLLEKTTDKTNFQYPKEDWWTDFQDPYLNECIAVALKDSPTLKDAASLIEKANVAYTQVSGTSLPFVNFNATYQKSKQSYHMGLPDFAVQKGFKDAPKVGLDFSYTLDLWDKNKNTIAAVMSNIEAAQLSYEQAKILLSTEIASAYVTLDQLYKMNDVVQNAIKIRGKTKDLFEKRFKEGLENESSYEQSKSAYHVSETEQESIQELIQLQKQKLCILMGKTPDYATSIQRPQLKQEKIIQPVDDIPSGLIGRRLDILIQKKLLESRAKMIQVAQSGYYPNFNIVGTMGMQSLGLNSFLKNGSSAASFGPTIQLPIFNQCALDAQYADATAEYNKTVAQYESTIINALHDVQSALVSRKALIKKINHMQAAQKAAQKAYDIAQDRYCGGLSTNMEVLRAEDALLSIKRTLTDLYKQTALVDIQLIRALGGGYQHTH